jgi:hypothetical protein
MCLTRACKYLLWSLSFILFVYPLSSTKAQVAYISSLPSSEAREAQAYRSLFRQALTYKRLADEADAAGKPDPHFRRILANRMQLDPADDASLLRIAQTYQKEIDPIRQRVGVVMKEYLAKFPGGIKPSWIDATPPPELSLLHSQDDAIALQCRDMLQSAMRPEDFQKVVSSIRTTFGQPSR